MLKILLAAIFLSLWWRGGGGGRGELEKEERAMIFHVYFEQGSSRFNVCGIKGKIFLRDKNRI
jgi:hypothetical protein